MSYAELFQDDWLIWGFFGLDFLLDYSIDPTYELCMFGSVNIHKCFLSSHWSDDICVREEAEEYCNMDILL